MERNGRAGKQGKQMEGEGRERNEWARTGKVERAGGYEQQVFWSQRLRGLGKE